MCHPMAMRKAKGPPRKPKRRNSKVERPYNGGEWTLARMKAFIFSALRGARWPVKYQVIKEAFVEHGINPKTGRSCKLHRCSACLKLVPQKEVRVDHIEPIVPIGHEWAAEGHFLGTNWDMVLRRMFVESEGLQALCEGCHNLKSSAEREARKNQ